MVIHIGKYWVNTDRVCVVTQIENYVYVTYASEGEAIDGGIRLEGSDAKAFLYAYDLYCNPVDALAEYRKSLDERNGG